jgi:hypothetical protein
MAAAKPQILEASVYLVLVDVARVWQFFAGTDWGIDFRNGY